MTQFEPRFLRRVRPATPYIRQFKGSIRVSDIIWASRDRQVSKLAYLNSLKWAPLKQTLNSLEDDGATQEYFVFLFTFAILSG